MMKKILPTLCLGCALFLGIGATPPQSSKETKVRTEPVRIGERAPDFKLVDLTGATVSLSAAGKKRPTVLVFYRGYW